MLGLGQLSFDLAPIRRGRAQTRTGVSIMAKRKKGSKVQKREKLPRGTSAKLRKARKAAPAKRTVAKAKPKRSPVKKAARKVKQPVTPVVETVDRSCGPFSSKATPEDHYVPIERDRVKSGSDWSL
jgi:hypothetical protein